VIKRYLFSLIVPVFLFVLSASFVDLRPIAVQFMPYWGDQPIEMDSVYFSERNKDSVKFSQLRFYISQLTICEGNFESLLSDYELIDLSRGTSFGTPKQYSSMNDITAVEFNLGIDSLTNSNGVGSGVLDPSMGMYWAWHSGYINLKLEGTSPSCTRNRGKFQFHLGGYSAPYNALRKVRLPVEKVDDVIRIKVDLKSFIDAANLKEQSVVMSPGADAMKLSDHAVNMFSILQ
jgi:hypothetical protein